MVQLLCHLWGDYILQSDWMAQYKTKESLPAAIHAFLYSLAFIVFLPWPISPIAWATILVTHFFIDRFRLAVYLVWAKNMLGPKRFFSGADRDDLENAWAWWGRLPPFRRCPYGSPPQTPVWLALWLLIIVDNTLHLTINYLALRFL